MNLAPSFHSERLVVIFLIALLFIPPGTQLQWRSRDLFRRQTLPSPGSAQNAIPSTGSASQNPSLWSAVPSSLLSFDEPQEFNGTCLVRERRSGATKLFNSKCCLSKTPPTRDSSADSPAGLFLMEWCFKLLFF